MKKTIKTPEETTIAQNFNEIPTLRISMQESAVDNSFMRKHYDLEAKGWTMKEAKRGIDYLIKKKNREEL